MKTIVAGSRSITDIQTVRDAIAQCGWTISEIVSGNARGVDTLGEAIAKERRIPVKLFPVSKEDWEYYGKKAGYIRNQRMADYAEALVCVWDGVSKGSKHMMDIAERWFKSVPI